MTIRKSMPCQTKLRILLRYEPETGKLFWRPRAQIWFRAFRDFVTWNAKNADREALVARDPYGYLRGDVLGVKYPAHRVVWRMITGRIPDQVDHIDGNRSNNRIENLRDVSNAENSRNQARPKSNTSGHLGVSWYARENKWQAAIAVNGRQKMIGKFKSLDDAVAARAEAEQAYGYHQNHGRSA